MSDDIVRWLRGRVWTDDPSKLDEAADYIEHQIASHEAMTLEIERLRADCAKLETAHGQNMREISRLRAELAAAREIYKTPQDEIDELCAERDAAIKERDEARAERDAERKKNKLTKLRFQQAQQMIKLLSQRSSTGSERPPSKREVEGSSPSVEATFRDELAAERERNAAPSEYDLALLAERDALRAALREIATVQYGLQGIIDEFGGDRNKENYFVRKYFGDEVSRYQQIARAALGDSLRREARYRAIAEREAESAEAAIKERDTLRAERDAERERNQRLVATWGELPNWTAIRLERDALRAELAAERERKEHYQTSFKDMVPQAVALREALREARPYVFKYDGDGRKLLARIDALLADGVKENDDEG